MIVNKFRNGYFVFVLLIFLGSFIMYYFVAETKEKIQLKKMEDANDKIKYYETMLWSVSNCITLNLESENCLVSDNILSVMENKKIRLSDLIDSEKIIFVRYAEENCGSCIDFIIPFVQKLSDSIGPENVIFLASYDSERLMIFFLRRIN